MTKKLLKQINILKTFIVLKVFDIIYGLLHENGGKAKKGNGRNYKLGQPGCELDTVVGAIAFRHFGKKLGESVYDPVFVLGAIMKWAEICHNKRGYLELYEQKTIN